MQLPCGRCIGCRLERSRQWAVRLVHENRFHDKSAFITLTYDNEHLPKDGSLNIKHFQDFMKRLRRAIDPWKIRFFHAGEYGEKFRRPHYHAIIFGYDFVGRKHDVPYEHDKNDQGDRTWQSPLLDELWEYGLNRVGSVTFESCAYVARYITKKISGPAARVAYDVVDYTTGEVNELKPEYATMSRRPGIGHAHFEKFHSSIYPSDSVVLRGHQMKPPKYYDRCLEKQNRLGYIDLKERRESALSASSKKDRSEQRLLEREVVKIAQTGTLKRRYEIG